MKRRCFTGGAEELQAESARELSRLAAGADGDLVRLRLLRGRVVAAIALCERRRAMLAAAGAPASAAPRAVIRPGEVRH